MYAFTHLQTSDENRNKQKQAIEQSEVRGKEEMSYRKCIFNAQDVVYSFNGNRS